MEILWNQNSAGRTEFPAMFKVAVKVPLRAGEVITVKVEDFSEGQAVINLDGEVFKAQSEVPLTPGSEIQLLVQGREGDKVVLRVLNGLENRQLGTIEYVPLEDIALLLPEANIPVTAETVLAAQALIRNGLSVTPENIHALLRFAGSDFSGITSEKLAAMAAAMAEGIELSPAFVSALDPAFQENYNLGSRFVDLSDLFSSLSAKISSQAADELSDILKTMRLDFGKPLDGKDIQLFLERNFTPVERPLAEAAIKIFSLLSSSPQPSPAQIDPGFINDLEPQPAAEGNEFRSPVLREPVRSLISQLEHLQPPGAQEQFNLILDRFEGVLTRAINTRLAGFEAVIQSLSGTTDSEAAAVLERIFADILPPGVKLAPPPAPEISSEPSAPAAAASEPRAEIPTQSTPSPPISSQAPAADSVSFITQGLDFKTTSELLILDLIRTHLLELLPKPATTPGAAPAENVENPPPVKTPVEPPQPEQPSVSEQSVPAQHPVHADAEPVTAADQELTKPVEILLRGILESRPPEPGPKLALRIAQDLQALWQWAQKTLKSGALPQTRDQLLSAVELLTPDRELTWLAQLSPDLAEVMDNRWILVQKLLDLLQSLDSPQLQGKPEQTAAPRDSAPLPNDARASLENLQAQLIELPEKIRIPLREFLRLEELVLVRLQKFTGLVEKPAPAATRAETAAEAPLRTPSPPTPPTTPIPIPEADAVAAHLKAMNLVNALETQRPDAPQFMVFEIPIHFKGQTKTATLKVFRRGDKSGGSPRDAKGQGGLKVAILIQTDNLREVQTIMELTEDELKGEFILKTEEIRSLFAAYIPELVQRLEGHQYKVNSFTAAKDAPVKRDKAKPKAARDQTGRDKTVGKIDIKV